MDHTISDIQQTAIVASHGGIAYLHGDGRIVTAISDAALHFAAHEVADTQYVSVFAQSDSVRDVTERGLKYRLDHATLSNLQVNGLSNEFIDGDAAQIAVGGAHETGSEQHSELHICSVIIYSVVINRLIFFYSLAD